MSDADEQTLYRVQLRPDHKPTGSTTHTVGGIVIGPPFELRIIQFEGDPGFYLIHLNEQGDEMTDTYHDSCERAMEQAEFEFGIRKEDWT